tara:strand:- start:213 stop:536 length:324 start_codon:yes stop_codon:yes gene_type:complete
MKSYFEKPEKLNVVLKKLKSFDLSKLNNKDDFNHLISQKNQLEIEKKELEKKFTDLKEEYQELKEKFNRTSNTSFINLKKEKEISEKIDELNQETDSLMDEIDKWQM